MRFVSFAAAISVAIAVLVPNPAFCQATPALSITNYNLVTSVRTSSRNYIYDTFTATVVNNGPALSGVTATVSSTTSNVTIVPGQNTLDFPAVAANGQATSLNTFTILVNATVALDYSTLQWSFNGPVANAGPNQSVSVGSTVTLNGSGSTNPAGNGSISYNWSILSAPTGSHATLQNPTSVVPQFVADEQGTYNIQLTVSNSIASSSASVSVSTTTIPPVANAGANQTVAVGSTVRLNGCASYDANGNPLTYSWTFVSYPSTSLTVLSNPSVINPTFLADVAGTYIVELTVNDGFNTSAPSMVAITTGHTPPVANAGPNQSVTIGSLVQLTGAGSTDISGLPLTYNWSLLSIPSGSSAALSNATSVNPIIQADKPGTYIAQLIVNDGAVNSAPSTVLITTNTVLPPTANAGINKTVLQGSTVTLVGSGTDPQGFPLTLTWSLISRPTTSIASLSSLLSVSDPTLTVDQAGTYVAQLVVNNGYMSSQPSTVSISTTNNNPVANAGPNQGVNVGSTVILNGSQSYDPNGYPMTFLWTMLTRPSGSSAVLTGSQTVSPSFVADVGGTYVAQLIVSDAYASSAPATVTISTTTGEMVLTPNPLNLFNSSGTLTITVSPANASAEVVNLGGYDPNIISVPSSVTVPAGATSTTVSVTPVSPGSTQITATSVAFQTATAIVNVSEPSIALSLGSTVGLGRSISGTITLSAPAPAAGVTVSLSASPSGVVTLGSPTVTFTSGQTSGTFSVTGESLNTANITATAPSYIGGSASVTVVSLGSITLANNVTVAMGQSTPLNVSLSAAAPSGGVTVSLSSGNTSILTVPSTVTINAGQTAPSIQPEVTGVGIGTVSVTASAIGYTSATTSVSSTGSLSFSPQAVTVSAGGVQNVSLLLSAPAPAGGLLVTLSSGTTADATVPANVTFGSGATSVNVAISGVAQGGSIITASATNVTSATANVTVNPAPSITTTSLATGTQGQPYTASVAASGGTPPYSWAAAALPTGLTISSSGAISGTPTTAGTFHPTFFLTDSTNPTNLTASKAIAITINSGLSITNASLPGGFAGAGYLATMTVSGGTSPYTWTATGLPAGLTMSSSGSITGTPTAAGTTSPSITVTDSSTPAHLSASTTSLSITIGAGLSITTSSLPGGIAGAGYSAQLAASGGTSPFTWTATGLPAGLTMNSSGAISGTPTAAGSSTPSITVTDSTSPTHLTATNTSLSITIGPGLSITNSSLPGGVVGASYSATLSASGGTSPYTWSATGLPAGLTISSSGAISGSPTAAGTSNPSITVTDSTSPTHLSASITNLSITIGSGLSITTSSLSGGVVGAVYSAQLAANGGTTPYTWTATGLPAGLTMSTSGAISGTPTAAGASTPSITVTDSTSPTHLTASVTNLSITIGAGLTITTSSLAGGFAGAAYSAQLAAGGGTSPYTWTVTGLPAGLTMSTSGAISGTPTAAGTSTPSITVTDSTSPTHLSVSNTSLSITIGAALSITTSSFPGGFAGANYTAQLAANGGTSPYTWTATGLPAGLTISTSGAISGTPTAAGTSTPSITVTDSTSPTHFSVTNSSLSITIGPGLSITTASLPSGVAGAMYSAQLVAGGGTSPYTWTATGLPAGLTMSTSGAISGTPTANGTTTPSFTVTDSTSPTHLSVSSTSLSITIGAGLTITTSSLPSGVVGAAYSAGMSASGGTAPYSWTASGLPAGLTMSTAGAISGTPTAAGTSTPSFTVTDSTNITPLSVSTANLSITIGATLSISTSSLPGGFAGANYTAQLAANGGTSPYTWTATGLPAGLTISTSGAISGTPTAAGTTNPSISVTDSTNPTHLKVSTTNLSITIGAALSVSTGSLPGGIVGVGYSASMNASGGTSPYTWTATGLPAGLTMNSSGAISGTPTAAGASTPSFTVTDSTSPTHLTTSITNLSITISPGVSITTASLPGGTEWVAYSAQLAATGGTSPYTWSATGLPAGLTMSTSGAISGTPTAGGASTPSITVTDSTTPTHLTATTSFPVSIAASVDIIMPSAAVVPPGGSGIFNITLAQPATTTVFLSLATSNSNVATLSVSQITFSAGMTTPGQTPYLLGVAPGTVTVTATPTAGSLNPASTQATVAYTVTPYPVSQTIVGSGTQANLVLSLSSQALGPVTLNLSSSNPSIASVPATAVVSQGSTVVTTVITAGSTAGNATITISGIGVVTTTASVQVLPPGSIGLTAAGTVGAGLTTPLTVTLSTAAPASGVTVNLTSSNTNFLTISPPSVTIAGGATTPTVTPQLQGVAPGSVNISASATGYTLASQLAVQVLKVSISTSSLPPGTVGSLYSTTVSASGGTAPYTWSATGLPAGLTMSTSGTISGTPTAAGTTLANITVTDSTAPTKLTATSSLSITIGTGVSVTTSSLPGGIVGAGYSASMSATGGVTPYTWTATGLPAGLTMNTAGAISGTPTATGTSTASITVTDSTSPTHLTSTANLSITIGAGLSVSTSSLTGGFVGAGYSASMAATGGTSPYSWTATGLPAGLTMNTAGAISGTPTATGTSTASFTVTDSTSPTHLTATANLSITIGAGLSITTGSLSGGFVGAGYSASMAASGGTSPYTWTATGLPGGLTMSTSGAISGTPTAVGTSNPSITVTDSTSPTHLTATTTSLSITIGAGFGVTTSSLPGGFVGAGYTANMTASGGTAPYTWTATGLPAGLTISTSGSISGTPTAAGTVTPSFTVTDSTTPTHLTATITNLSITIGGGLTITTSSLPGGTTGAAYSASMGASGGTSPYTWTVTGLPAGLTMSSTGSISGSPMAAGASTPSFTVTDSTNPTHLTASTSLSITVSTGLAITTSSLPGGVVGEAYSTNMAASGGVSPYTWSATGLPSGLTMSSAGAITGTPLVAVTTNNLTITVTDSTSPTHLTSTTTSLSITIGAGLSITTSSLSAGYVGAPYLSSMAATGGTSPYTWTVTGLPAGLTMNSAGAITGTPTAIGTSTPSFTVTDSTSPTHLTASINSLSIIVSAGVTVNNTSLPNTILGETYSVTMSASGGTSPYTWTATGLPAGLTMQSYGLLSGAPSTAGTFTPSITVTDSTTPTHISTTVTSLSLTVGPGPTISNTSLSNGIVGANYSAQMTVTGGTSPYTWSVIGLPSGLTMSTSGAISGTPLSAGTTTPSISVTDSSTPSNLKVTTTSLTITIGNGLAISSTSLPGGIVGLSYSASLQATGGTSPYSWTASNLPAGLTMSTAGAISGTPTATGSVNPIITVTDSTTPTHLTFTGSNLSITIAPGVSVSTSSLSAGIAGVVYSASLSATGGTAPYSWTATGLPAGLTMSTSGAISGTPTAAGTVTPSFTVTDSSSPTHLTASTNSVSITIGPGVSITTSSLQNGVAGGVYSASLAATGGTAPYSWTATGLPAGLTMTTAGAISGTPTAAGTVSPSFTVTDSSSPNHLSVSTTSLSITIGAGLSISTASLPNGVINVGYSANMAATGGNTPYTWSVSGLPAGLTMNSAGAISGTPAVITNATPTFTVTDSTNPTHLTVSTSLSISVSNNVVISTSSLPGGFVGAAYSGSVAASGGTSPYSFTVSGLPAGLTMTTAGALSGTPTAAGTVTPTFTVTDSTSPTHLTNTASISIVVSPALAITTGSLSSGIAGEVYSASMAAIGGTSPYTWTATGLPAGLVMSTTGAISGTPTAAGTVTPTITVTDSTSPTHFSVTNSSLSITIGAGLAIGTSSLPIGEVGEPYSVSLSASGGTSPYTWTASGLPAGLTMSTAGAISGTPTAAGTVSPSITVTDVSSPNHLSVTTTSLSITVTSGLTVSTTSLATGFAGTAYSAQMAALGGTAPYSWAASGLPAGLTMNTAGAISGTPTAAGTINPSFTVTDSSTPTHLSAGTASISIVIAPALAITTSSLSSGVAGEVYSASMAAIGGTSPYSWTATGLPAGLVMNSAGAISGTPTAAGTVTPTITVTDSTSPTHFSVTNSSLSITIGAGLAISTASLPSSEAGEPYSASLGASGGTSPYTWTAAGLPAGLVMSTSGAISGTPTASGTISPSITVTDSSSPNHLSITTTSLSITIGAGLTVSTASLPGGLVGEVYSASMSATGGTSPYTWTAAGLPAGLIMNSSGAISGTPTTTGTVNPTFTVSDSSSPTHLLVTTSNISITIGAGLSIGTASLPGGFVGVSYSTSLSASGGTSPYTWTVTGLPAGLTMSTAGAISGSPTASGTSTPSFTVTDVSSPNHLSVTKSLSIAISPGLGINLTPLPNGITNQAYTASVTASGGTSPYTWSVIGLPAGLTMTTAGAISGTPTNTGATSPTFTVTDSTTPTHLTNTTSSLTITITGPLAIGNSSLPGGFVGVNYTATMNANGGTSPYTWTATGLPAGLTMSTAGAISGTPTATGTSSPSITVTDSSSPNHLTVSTTSLSITIGAALSVSTSTLPGGFVAAGYSASLTASGGTSPYSWTVTGLPAGLTMNTSGAISGTPTATGSTTPTFTVTDSTSPTHLTASTSSLSIVVGPALTIATSSLSSGIVGEVYAASLAATGGTSPYTWTASGLPAGLTMNTAGNISGTPTAAGTFSPAFTVTDSTLPSHITVSTTSLSITIGAGLSIGTSTLPSGLVGEPYSANMTAAGGTSPYSWSVTTLPTGLTMSTSGAISGTPTNTGTVTPTFTVTDTSSPNHLTVNTSISITIGAGLSISTVSLSNGFTGVAYSAAINASGGTVPYTWSVTGLPAGLTMTTAGAISGTPTATGTTTPTFTVTDSSNPVHLTATTSSLSITIGTGLSVSTTTLTGGFVGSAYSATMAASGGTTPYSWSATGLPAGLTMNTSGFISGTPTAIGTSTPTFTVTDSTSPTHLTANTSSVSITIGAALAISTSSLPNGFTGTNYSVSMAATGGTSPYAWSVSGLPAGLTMSTAGAISGTPTATGTTHPSFTVTDSTSPTHLTLSSTLSLTVTPGLAITNASLPGAFTGLAYSGQMAASGGTSPYSWSVTGLPAGLTMSTSGAITGTPSTAATTASPTFTVTDNTSPTHLTLSTSSLAINVGPQLSITTTAFAVPTAASAYSFQMQAAGGTTPYSWSITNLPSGLTMSTSGLITGTPLVAGNRAVFPTVTDASSPQQSASATIFMNVQPAPLVLICSVCSNGALPTAALGSLYSEQLTATGGLSPLGWSASGLPSTLSMNSTTGVISGTPTANGTYAVTVTVIDSDSPLANSQTATYTLVVGSGGTVPQITLSNVTIGQYLQTEMLVTVNPAPSSGSTLTLNSSNPSAVMFYGQNGVVSGSNVQYAISANTSSFSVYVQSQVTSGTYTITATMPGYQTATSVVTAAPSGFVIATNGGIGDSLSTYEGQTSTLTVYSSVLNDAGTFVTYQPVAYGQSVTVPVQSTMTSVGTVSTGNLAFTGGISSSTLNFVASNTNTGTTSVVLSTPTGFTTPTAGTSIPVTVASASIIPQAVTIGNNLEAETYVSLTGPASQSLTLTITSSNPSQLLFSTSPTGTGSTQISITIPANFSGSPNFYMQGFGSSGSVGYTIYTPSLGTVNATATLAPSGLILVTPSGNDASFSMAATIPEANLSVETAQLDPVSGAVDAVQPVAPGQSVSVTVSSSNTSVGTISSSPVVISGGSSSASTEFVPSTSGSSTLSATSTGYTSASANVTVTEAGMNCTNGISIGQFLQEEGSCSLGAPAPAGGLTLTITADSSGDFLFSNTATGAGSSSIQVFVPGGGFSVNFYIQAAKSSGTAGYTASAPGFISYTASSLTCVPSGIVILGSTSASVSGGADTLTVYTAQLTSGDVPNEPENLAGGNSLTVTLNNTNPNAGGLPASVVISPNTSSTNVLFTPSTAGTQTTVSVTQPAGWSLPTSLTSLTISVGN